ncbi:ML3 [Symbiodinium sp. CCMP2456]|nr:ML3 [Symbiodinium sp. CCMP2456]
MAADFGDFVGKTISDGYSEGETTLPSERSDDETPQATSCCWASPRPEGGAPAQGRRHSVVVRSTFLDLEEEFLQQRYRTLRRTQSDLPWKGAYDPRSYEPGELSSLCGAQGSIPDARLTTLAQFSLHQTKGLCVIYGTWEDMEQRGAHAEPTDILRLLRVMNEARYDDCEDDDNEDCEEMDMNADGPIHSDADGKHRDLPPLKPRYPVSKILSRGNLHLDNPTTQVESVSFHCHQTGKRRRAVLPVPPQAQKRRRGIEDPEKMGIPVYAYYEDEACIELRLDWSLTLAEAMQTVEDPGCGEKRWRTTCISVELSTMSSLTSSESERLRPNGLVYLAEAMQTEQDVRRWIRALRHWQQPRALLRVHLEHNFLNEHDAAEVLQSVGGSVAAVYLHHNDIRSLQALADSDTLQELHLSHNRLSTAETRALLLQPGSTRSNGIGTEVSKVCSWLRLEFNHIGVDELLKHLPADIKGSTPSGAKNPKEDLQRWGGIVDGSTPAGQHALRLLAYLMLISRFPLRGSGAIGSLPYLVIIAFSSASSVGVQCPLPRAGKAFMALIRLALIAACLGPLLGIGGPIVRNSSRCACVSLANFLCQQGGSRGNRAALLNPGGSSSELALIGSAVLACRLRPAGLAYTSLRIPGKAIPSLALLRCLRCAYSLRCYCTSNTLLRNLPNNYSRDMLLAMLDKRGFAGRYDFVYLPFDFRRDANLGYAFVNMVDAEAADALWKGLEGFTAWALTSHKVCSVTWSGPLQGQSAHIERYRNSPVMHSSVPDQYKPVILEAGVRKPFPKATKKIKMPTMVSF